MHGAGHADVLVVFHMFGNKADAVPCERLPTFTETTFPPTTLQVAEHFGVSIASIENAFERLADAHHIALAPGSYSIWIAHPQFVDRKNSLAEPKVRQGIDCKLPDKIGHRFGNGFRGGKLLLPFLDNPHDPCHISAQNLHDLFAFSILLHFSRVKAMGNIPVV